MNVRIAAISDDLHSDFGGALTEAVALGLDGLAVRHVNGVNVRDLAREEIEAIAVAARERDLAISAVSSPVGRDVGLGEDDADSLVLLDRMLDYAQILGSDLVRVFAPWIPGKDPLAEWWERPAGADRLERTAAQLERYASRAAAAGVTVMVELEGASHIGQVAEAAAVLEMVDSTALALCWDICNGWWSGEAPWPAGWSHARGLRIVDVQTKDVRARPEDHRPELTLAPLTRGAILYDAIIEALLRDGYDGWFTAERVYHPRRPESDEALLNDIRGDVAALRRLVDTVRSRLGQSSEGERS